MVSLQLQPLLTSLLDSLPPSPVEKSKLDELVARTISESRVKSSPENRKVQWEYLLKNDVFLLAANEGTALKTDENHYYEQLSVKLDLALTFTEQDACEQTFPFTFLQDLLETQTIASCSHIFSWIESRAPRLTEGMIPQKGKALILLRTLNDLLRRLSKMGGTTIFCGRILTFLSGVFPLGERSGVNLRGEYGPTWEGVHFSERLKHDDKATVLMADEDDTQVKEDDKMQVDPKPSGLQTIAEKKEDFYNTFWSLQLPFSKPPLFANQGTFGEFKEAVNKVMPVIKEATAKERAMMGSRISAGGANTLKRKRDTDEENNSNEYFFAKFLTSPDLLDLEIADTHFRRQFLFQLLILMNHLLSFTKSTKAAWTTPRNRSLQMDFNLEESDAQWVQETSTKVIEELRQTTPNGRAFADTVSTILERERNWVKWKNELCTPFDKEPWAAVVGGNKVGLFDATKGIREKMQDPPSDWKWRLGTEPLTEIWEMGYTSLHDLQNPFQTGDIKDFVKKIKLEDGRIALKKQRLEKISALAKARAWEAAKATTTPSITFSSEPAPSKVEALAPRAETVPGTLAAPRPAVSVGNSPIHPSLPPKPGSPSKLASSLQEPLRNAAPSPRPPEAVAPAPAQLSVTTPISAPAPAMLDPEIAKYEENKHRWAWLALRAARDQYLQHFSKIGAGDIEALAQEIEREREEKDKSLKGEGISAEEQGSGSPSSGMVLATESSESNTGDGDVKMDG